MKRFLLLFYLSVWCHLLWAESLFIRTNNNQNFGQAIRIVPLVDDGWIVFSSDSLKVSRYDRCTQLIYSNKYNIPSDLTGKVDITGLMDLSCVILTQNFNGVNTSPVITRIDSSGNVIWCKTLSNPLFNEQSCSITADSSGFIYMVSLASSAGQSGNVITKLDYSGNILSEVILDLTDPAADALLTSDNGMLIRSGNRFIKTASDGSVQWSTSVAGPGSAFSKPVEAGNGFVFSCNVSLAGAISIMKLNASGIISVQKRTDFFGLPAIIKMRKDGNLCGLFTRTISGVSYPTMVDIDTNLNIIRQHSVDYSNLGTRLRILDIGFLNNGSPVIAGITNPTGFLIFGRTDALYNTGCDTTLAAIQTQSESASQSVVNFNLGTLNRVATDLPLTQVNLTDSETVLCSVPDKYGIAGSTLICGDRPVTLFNIASDYFEDFLWSTGETAMEIAVNIPGTYWLKAVGKCDLDTVITVVNVIQRDPVPFELGDDRYKCETNTLVLSGPDCDHCTYSWNDGSHGKTMTVKSYGKQVLRVVNDGCATSDSILIQNAKCECHFFLPNTITPNHDGVNDLLKPVYYCDLKDYSLNIFNRWGELIFETDDPEQGWDATYFNVPVIQDIYVYLVKYTILTEGVAGEQVTTTGSVGVVY